jgi:predicted  nucleic acid-binding Zn-ribbon protein
MEDLHAGLKDLQLLLQTLLKKYTHLKKENEELKKEIENLNELLIEKRNLINKAEEKITANNISTHFDSEEKKLLQSKIDIYLKDIEKCLALLNA